MWKQLFDLFRGQLFLARDAQENKEKIAALRRELEELSSVVEKLQVQIQHASEREQHEREKFMLRVENTLLRFERSLPDPKRRRRGK